jgi:hypothetical protein
MMWIVRRVLVLKDATMNSNPNIVTNLHESNTIFLLYNIMVPSLLYVTIFLYFEWFEYWCEDLFWVLILVSFKHRIWYVCKLWFVSIFWKWNDKDLVFNDWIIVSVCLKGCKYGTHNCHWVVVLNIAFHLKLICQL